MLEETQQLSRPNFPRLTALVNVDTRERIDLTGDRIAIGRRSDNKIPLPDDIYVSGLHAVIYYEHQMWWLQDLNSTNGTLKNGNPVVDRVDLQPGDLITIGRARFDVI